MTKTAVIEQCKTEGAPRVEIPDAPLPNEASQNTAQKTALAGGKYRQGGLRPRVRDINAPLRAIDKQ